MDPVRYGLIGLGWWARNVHLPNIDDLLEGELVAISSRSDENIAAATEGRSKPVQIFHDYRDLLACEEVEAVVVCVPNFLHEQVSCEALAAGKHVLCEKPMALTLEGCNRVVEAVEKSDKVYQVGLELRYADTIRCVQELIEKGWIGERSMLWYHMFRMWGNPRGWRADKMKSGGVFFELICHYLDLLWFLSGGAPTALTGMGGADVFPIDVDHGWLSFEFSNGTKGMLGLCLFADQGEEMRGGVIGTEGFLEYRLGLREVTLKRRSGEHALFSWTPGSRPIRGFDGTLQQHINFCQCIRSGRRPVADCFAGRGAVILALAAERALAERTRIELDPSDFVGSEN